MTTDVVSPLAKSVKTVSKGEKMTEKQIPKLVGALVEHQAHFVGLSVEDGQWAIRNTPDAITLCVEAISNRSNQVKEKSKVSSDSLIRIDRTIRPTYPEWFKELVHPELESVGPSEFDAAKLEHWLHPDQVNGTVGGKKLLKYLEDKKMLESCLGLRDLEEIQRKGIAFFRKHFQGKAVFGWRSVVRDRHGILIVPCLVEFGVEVVVIWHWFALDWHANDPALRFAN